MKKIIFAIIAMFVSVSCFAQLTVKPSNNEKNSTTVYKWGGTLANPRMGAITYTDNTYILLGSSSNRYETNFHTIVLGETKEQAITSVTQLSTLSDSLGKKDELKVLGIKGETTIIFKSLGTVVFVTNGVAGWTDVLWNMKFDKAIEAIQNYEEN